MGLIAAAAAVVSVLVGRMGGLARGVNVVGGWANGWGKWVDRLPKYDADPFLWFMWINKYWWVPLVTYEQRMRLQFRNSVSSRLPE